MNKTWPLETEAKRGSRERNQMEVIREEDGP